TVNELRDDRRAQDRKLRDLQHQLDLMREKQVVAQVGMVGADPVPTLPVEVAAPTNLAPGQRVVGVTDDGTEIVYEGDAATGKAAIIEEVASPPPTPRVVARSPERVERAAARTSRSRQRTDDAPGERATVAGDPANDYRLAVDLVKSGPQEQAVAALRAFLQKYPRHDYADNAQYWLGEAFYAAKDYPRALVEFRTVIETYPRGNKVPDALLKVGYCYAALGQADKSHAVLEQVVNLYPKTEPAALAAKRLETK
ncbi:MAG: tol-pal system protein YbgF, partial [Proteobacteria bacterium]|nr:tol-pal system protein YbgF [Pseudomonadota bacterium]